MKSKLVILLAFLVLNAGCSVSVQEGSGAAPTSFIVTLTLPPSSTLSPSETPLPPPPTPTTAPVEGTVSTQINVREQPSTAGEVLGILPANTKVQIVGRDPGGNWWQILYPQAGEGTGWVTAQYVIMISGTPNVPVIGGRADSGNGNVAVIQQQLNVRSGPGTDFNSLGTLNPQDVVNLTGKDANGAWLQIEYTSGPDGKGWINAAFAQANGVENLPIVTEAGKVVGTGTPVNTAPPPTPTLLPAPLDEDSANRPIKTVFFDRAGIHTLIYNGDVSAPDGDTEDWLAFTTFSGQILLETACQGNVPHFELLQNGAVLEQSAVVGCGTRSIVPVEPNNPVLVHVSAVPTGSQSYSSYIVKVSTIP